MTDFEMRKVQIQKRVAIPPNILDEAGLSEQDWVKVYFENGEIHIRPIKDEN